jgi:hypothetical protein
MRSKQVFLTLGTLVLAGSLLFTSCRKKSKEAEDPDSDQSAAQENQIAENHMNDVAAIGAQGSENGNLTTYRMGPGEDLFGISSASVTFGVKTFTVDFGPYPGMNCLDGRKRSGKLMFDYSASTNSATAYRMPGYSLSITAANYTVDDYTVNIVNKTITNTTPLASVSPSLVPGTNLTWNIVANVNIIKPSSAGGGTITWSCNRTKTLANTSNTLCYNGQGVPINWSKARIQIDGSASGMTAGGESYTSVITGLTRDFGTCGAFLKYPWIQGKVDFTPGSKATRYIDFGAGTCDRAATVTIKSITYSFNF